MTPLRGADGKVYALAQGPLVISGFPRPAPVRKSLKTT